VRRVADVGQAEEQGRGQENVAVTEGVWWVYGDGPAGGRGERRRRQPGEDGGARGALEWA